jgi:hypothetical protein
VQWKCPYSESARAVKLPSRPNLTYATGTCTVKVPVQWKCLCSETTCMAKSNLRYQFLYGESACTLLADKGLNIIPWLIYSRFEELETRLNAVRSYFSGLATITNQLQFVIDYSVQEMRKDRAREEDHRQQRCLNTFWAGAMGWRVAVSYGGGGGLLLCWSRNGKMKKRWLIRMTDEGGQAAVLCLRLHRCAVTALGGAGITRGRLAGSRKQHQNLPNPAGRRTSHCAQKITF